MTDRTVSRRALLATIGSAAVAGVSEWPAFQSDRVDSGVAAGTTGPTDDVTETWTLETDERICASPVVVDGTAYVDSSDNRPYAVARLTRSPGRTRR